MPTNHEGVKAESVLEIARGYAVDSSPLHVNRLACALLSLHTQNEELRRQIATLVADNEMYLRTIASAARSIPADA